MFDRDHISKHLEASQKHSVILPTLFSVFENVFKYGVSCFIYFYLKKIPSLAKISEVLRIY